MKYRRNTISRAGTSPAIASHRHGKTKPVREKNKSRFYDLQADMPPNNDYLKESIISNTFSNSIIFQHYDVCIKHRTECYIHIKFLKLLDLFRTHRLCFCTLCLDRMPRISYKCLFSEKTRKGSGQE